LLRDQRGEAETVEWLYWQLPLWFLVTLVIVVALAGIRLAGAASHGHLAARQAGAATLAAGQQAAQAAEVWGVPSQAIALAAAPEQRAVVLSWDYQWWSGIGLVDEVVGAFRVSVQGLTRREAFYGGPASTWE